MSEGIYVALATPFQNKEVDYDTLSSHQFSLVEKELPKHVVCGDTGEWYALTIDERKQIAEIANDYCEELIVGIGSNSIRTIEELIKHGNKLSNVQGFLAPPPSVPEKASLDGLIRFYNRIFKLSEHPVILYNRYNAHVKISHNLVDSLKDKGLEFEIKDSAGDLKLIKHYKGQDMINGDDDLILESLKQGVGCIISGLANCWPTLISGIYNSYQEDKMTIAKQYQDAISGKIKVIQKYPYPSVVKALIPGHDPYVRLPNITLSKKEIDNLKKEQI